VQPPLIHRANYNKVRVRLLSSSVGYELVLSRHKTVICNYSTYHYSDGAACHVVNASDEPVLQPFSYEPTLKLVSAANR
jgi:hypothetical protein